MRKKVKNQRLLLTAASLNKYYGHIYTGLALHL